ncbi:calcineurin-like phosphoesterase C-terminal domain-containing protein [Pedobacter immunditicola]|uniref:calcineurin-like phosphoesterase C-terminal domain-containing protein n=1 Tax=Pedobacter immunditicola TaxID=3133440 RepID=UPI00309B459B
MLIISPWMTFGIASDGTPKGYGVYEVKGNALTWYYKSTGFDKSEQLRIAVDELTNQKRVIANVWNADPEWKIECWLDGKPAGAMERISGFDPLALAQVADDSEKTYKRFPKPRKTEHLFLCHAPASTKKVQVVVTDRFGNTYEKSWEEHLVG